MSSKNKKNVCLYRLNWIDSCISSISRCCRNKNWNGFFQWLSHTWQEMTLLVCLLILLFSFFVLFIVTFYFFILFIVLWFGFSCPVSLDDFCFICLKIIFQISIRWNSATRICHALQLKSEYFYYVFFLFFLVIFRFGQAPIYCRWITQHETNSRSQLERTDHKTIK